MAVNIEIKGVTTVSENIEKLGKEMMDSAKKALWQCGGHLGNAAVNLAPVRTGDLRASMQVNGPDESGDKIEVTVSFSTPYAVRMHEAYYNLGPTSSKAPGYDGEPVGRKYLERPLMKYAEKYKDILKTFIEGSVK